ncbi:MAG: 3-hydroxyacyl-ACP dehydratase FabZ [Clostridia bacterium]|nr:3-hydroxyacyl-ACP dehydratase FabZ [Clostridia bacterium]
MELNIQEIMETIPHRYPFLLVDKIIELEEGKRAVGIKNVTMNEPFFQGHFPGRPIMPGVLICEALAQVGAVVIHRNPEFKDKLAVFTGIDNFKFRHQVVPGETLRLEVELTKMRGVMGKADVCAYVGDDVAAKGEISFALVDNK